MLDTEKPKKMAGPGSQKIGAKGDFDKWIVNRLKIHYSPLLL